MRQWTEKSLVKVMVTGHNGHKPKRPQPKRPQTETATNRNGHRPERPQTETATDRNGHKPERPQTETATDRNGHKPKRPQTGTATNRNRHNYIWFSGLQMCVPFRFVAVSVCGRFGFGRFGLWPLWPESKVIPCNCRVFDAKPPYTFFSIYICIYIYIYWTHKRHNST